jgi:hypothetical protein
LAFVSVGLAPFRTKPLAQTNPILTSCAAGLDITNTLNNDNNPNATTTIVPLVINTQALAAPRNNMTAEQARQICTASAALFASTCLSLFSLFLHCMSSFLINLGLAPNSTPGSRPS